jgi:hypothetical protein
MNEATLGILITANDTATPKLQGLQNTLSNNRMAIRELGMGVTYLGTTFLGLGIALQRSNSELGRSVGNTVLMVGAIMSAVGSSIQFISAIAKMIHALRALTAAQILAQAFSPIGIATLAVGGIIAGVTMASVSNKAQTAVAKGTTVNVNVQGSVVTARKLADEVRTEIIKTQDRNATSGIR